MHVEETNLENVLLIKPYVFEDYRGYYIETYNEKEYDNICKVKFVQDDVSLSSKNVIRGIHGDSGTWKLISCLKGRIYTVIVNCNEESDMFGRWQSFILSDVNHHQILIPPKYGNSFLVLSEEALFHYKQSTYYGDNKQFTYRWDDEKFNILWPTDSPILSLRDNA